MVYKAMGNDESKPRHSREVINAGEFLGWEYGERDSVLAASTNGEDIWRGNELSATPSAPASHVLIPKPADAGEAMAVISEDAQDGVAGTGIREITIEYLSATGAPATTTVTMNGLTAVALTPLTVRFVQNMYASEVGSGGVAAGNIRIYKVADNTLVYNMIAAGANISTVPHRMVPKGKTLFLKGYIPTEATAAKRCRIRPMADCSAPISGLTAKQGGIYRFLNGAAIDGPGAEMPLFDNVPELSIVKGMAWTKVDNAEVGFTWWGILKPNRQL